MNFFYCSNLFILFFWQFTFYEITDIERILLVVADGDFGVYCFIKDLNVLFENGLCFSLSLLHDFFLFLKFLLIFNISWCFVYLGLIQKSGGFPQNRLLKLKHIHSLYSLEPLYFFIFFYSLILLKLLIAIIQKALNLI